MTVLTKSWWGCLAYRWERSTDENKIKREGKSSYGWSNLYVLLYTETSVMQKKIDQSGSCIKEIYNLWA